MTRRNDELTAALAPVLTVESGWSEDPMIVLRLLAAQAGQMVEHLSTTKPRNVGSIAYWRFVAEQCESARERIITE
jgi:hypothetical protein